MRIPEFATKYEITPSAIYGRMARFEDAIHKPLNSKVKHIDEAYFLRRKKFQTLIVQTNYSYYDILQPLVTDTFIAKYLVSKTSHSLHVWQTWLNQCMWRQVPESILDYRITKMHWTFNKYIKQLIKDI